MNLFRITVCLNYDRTLLATLMCIDLIDANRIDHIQTSSSGGRERRVSSASLSVIRTDMPFIPIGWKHLLAPSDMVKLCTTDDPSNGWLQSGIGGLPHTDPSQ